MNLSDEKIEGKKDFDKLLSESLINTSIRIDKPPTILSIKEVGTSVKIKRLFTLGNFSAIIGKMKAKKTYLLSILTSAILKGTDFNNRFIGELPEGKDLVIYIDTEQSDYDAYNCIRRIEYMSESKDNFRAFNLRKFSPKERVEIIEFIFNKFGEKISLVIIDGIADLVMAINDEIEATNITSMLLKYTALYNCHVSTVIHQNKMNDFATGHIGSAIMKKAELIISVKRCDKIANSSDVVCDMSRGEGFEPFIITINEKGLPYVNDYIKVDKEVMFYDNVENKESNLDAPF